MQIALFVGALLGLLIIPYFGWRPMFWIAAIGAGVVWYLRKNIPESPRWLEHKGRLDEAETVLRRIEAQCPQPLPEPAAAAAARAPTSFYSRQFLQRLFVGSVTVIVLNVVVFGFLTFVPTFFVKAGLSVQKSLGFSTIMTLGGPVGGFIALYLSDRIGRKKLLVGSALLTALVGCFYPYAGNGLLITLVGFILVTVLYVNSTTAYSMFVPELFPTDVRLRGVGTCHTIGRIAGAVAPMVVVPLYSAYGVAGVIALMVGFLLAQALVVWTLGIEPRFQSLEALDVTEADGGAVEAVAR
jgi:putative MFS transporter